MMIIVLPYCIDKIKSDYRYYQDILTETSKCAILSQVHLEELHLLGRRNLKILSDELLYFNESYFKLDQEDLHVAGLNRSSEVDQSSDSLALYINDLIHNTVEVPLLTGFRDSNYVKKGENVIFFDKNSNKWLRGIVIVKNDYSIRVSGTLPKYQNIEDEIDLRTFQFFSHSEFKQLSELIKTEKGLSSIQLLLRKHEAIATYQYGGEYLKTLLNPKTYSNF